VTFTVTVTNTSPTDAVTINSLIDTIYGDLTNLTLNPGSTCTVPRTIPATNPDSVYTCTFTKSITGNAGTPHTNVVEACGVDDDNVPLCRNGSETVNILDVAPAATLTKTVDSAKVTFKVDVRKLKRLGLTQSFEVGYELSPRGRAYLEATAETARRPRRPGGVRAPRTASGGAAALRRRGPR
jgi:hypothetical protein